MDPSEEWYFKTFFDLGEFGVGLCTVPLQPSADCPSNAVFMDGYYAGQDGKPVKISNAFCIFEQEVGRIMWRHSEFFVPGENVSSFYRLDFIWPYIIIISMLNIYLNKVSLNFF